LTANNIPAPNRAMKKTRMTVLTLALCFAAATMCFAESPQMGTWKLNEAKSKLIPDTGKNTTVTYSAAKGDKVKVTVEGVDKDGKPTHSVWVGMFDGKVYPVKGNLTYNAVMYKMVDDHTNDITAMKDGKVAWTGTIKVAKDGKSRVVTINSTDAGGKKMKGKAFYDKG
jgi:hypothetical protein